MGYDLDYTPEPRIIHSPLLRKWIDKDLEPDYVVGIFRDRLSDLMSDQFVTSKLQDQPVADNGEDILFPFMLAEAKKEDGDEWESVYCQSVMPIYTMLSVQWRLRSANYEMGYDFDFDPVVWFFAYRGQHWELHFAYLDTSCEVYAYAEHGMCSIPCVSHIFPRVRENLRKSSYFGIYTTDADMTATYNPARGARNATGSSVFQTDPIPYCM